MWMGNAIIVYLKASLAAYMRQVFYFSGDVNLTRKCDFSYKKLTGYIPS